MSEPVKIKLYGLISLTKRTYLRQFFAALTLAAIGLGAWLWVWPATRRDFTPPLPTSTAIIVSLLDAVPYVILAIVGLQILEAIIVLRWFRQKGA